MNEITPAPQTAPNKDPILRQKTPESVIFHSHLSASAFQPGKRPLGALFVPPISNAPYVLNTPSTQAHGDDETDSMEAASCNQWLEGDMAYSFDEIVGALLHGEPTIISDFSEHLFKVGSLLYDGKISLSQSKLLEEKFIALMLMLPRFIDPTVPYRSHLYLIVELCFDVFIKLSTNVSNLNLATKTIRFLTTLVMSMNYWEINALLRSRPAIYQFLLLIHFDFTECYSRFLRDYSFYQFIPDASYEEVLRRADELAYYSMNSNSSSPLFGEDKLDSADEHDRFVSEHLAHGDRIPKDRKRANVDRRLSAYRIVKRGELKNLTAKSSNYDPDVVHECQLPSPELPGRLCLRRFSRKYELIRHQETVHSKKKKLFKCFVCVKQDPSNGPRIFTRHDTLAKHIRVNHGISGKEAKAEVAYSTKHAEIVEDGDISVQVGRRKTKVDFELRAHMDKKKDLDEVGISEGEEYNLDSAPEDDGEI